ALDLVWTGIDLRLTEKGEYFFFEANPSPMFLGFQSRCDLPLSESLIDLLVK
ncbi:MAG: RimK-like protein, partial [bacterium]|nr:RimK-like protein [bacterium]